MSSPQLSAAPLVPSMRQAGPPEKVAPEVTFWQDFLPIVFRFVVTYRWPLTPVAGVGVVLICGFAAPGSLVVPLLVGALVMEVWRRRELRFGGRKWLSKVEKAAAVEWLGVVGAWSLLAPLVVARQPARPVLLALCLLLVGGTTRAGLKWSRSRMPKSRRVSDEVQKILRNWAISVAVWGADPIRGSKVIRHSVVEPAPGAASFSVQLRPGIHPRECVTEAVVNSVERLLQLPVGTTHLAIDRSSSEVLQVNVAPKRHLETEPVPWLGPEWDKGRTTLAGALDGSQVKPMLSDGDGVLHALVSGTSGAGKSRLLRAISLVEPANRLGVLLLIDGGRGTSCPDLEPAAKVYATKPEQWKAVIRSVYAVYQSRAARRGDQRKTRFVVGSDEPTVTLAIDEPGAVIRVIGEREHEMVLEMLQQGRKLGIRIIQCPQDPMADEIIGGRKARGLLGGAGLVVALRAGDGMASRLTLSSTSQPLDLTELPAAPGSCWMVERGQVLTGNPVRCVDAHEEAAAAAAAAVEILELHPDDEAALWATWEAELAATLPEEDVSAEMYESDAAMLAILAAGPKRLGDIAPKDKKPGDEGWHPDWAWSRQTASSSLIRLMGQERVTKDGDMWSLATERVGAEQ